MTQNQKLNALADRFAYAIYQHHRREHGRDVIALSVNGRRVLMDLTGGAVGVRALVDMYCLDVIKASCQPQWQTVVLTLLTGCLDRQHLTDIGREMWQNMVKDMGDTVANNGGANHAQH